METMSPLEDALVNQSGINIVLRKKLIQAYRSENGRTEVPALLRENEHLINPSLYAHLLKLAAKEDALV